MTRALRSPEKGRHLGAFVQADGVVGRKSNIYTWTFGRVEGHSDDTAASSTETKSKGVREEILDLGFITNRQIICVMRTLQLREKNISRVKGRKNRQRSRSLRGKRAAPFLRQNCVKPRPPALSALRDSPENFGNSIIYQQTILELIVFKEKIYVRPEERRFYRISSPLVYWAFVRRSMETQFDSFPLLRTPGSHGLSLSHFVGN